MKKSIIAGVVAALLVAGGVTASLLSSGGRHVPPGQPPLLTLSAENLSHVREAFNAHTGHTRIVAFLSL